MVAAGDDSAIMAIRKRHPNRVPLIMHKHHTCAYTLDKTKYLVPLDITVQQFMLVLRKRLRLTPGDAVFLLHRNTLLAGDDSIGAIHTKYGEGDGSLHLTYTSENTFG